MNPRASSPGEGMFAEHEPTRAQIKRWRKHLAEERMEARTYRDLSERRTGEERAVLRQLEDAERRHEEYWLARLGEHALPAPRPPLRTRAAAVLAHLFGTIFILAMAQRAGRFLYINLDGPAGGAAFLPRR